MFKFITSKKRSELMRKIRSDNTAPELLLRKKLLEGGFRFNRKPSRLPGKPDIVINKHRITIFIDGEFWHGYKWREKKKKLKANRAYWIPKIERTILRDKKNNKVLRKAGWRIIRFWQHQISKDGQKCIQKIIKIIKRNSK